MPDKKIIEHLEELRACVMRALIGLVVCVIIGFFFVSLFFRLLSKPFLDYLAALNISTIMVLRSLSPGETFQMSMHAALLFGFGVSLPWIFYQLWGFVSPGLYKNEKKGVFIFCIAGFGFFLIGVAFAYFVTLPAALSFFYEYTTGMGIAPDWTISNYYNFVIAFLVCFGVVFELPVAIVILTWLGIVEPGTLAKRRKHAIIIIFIVAAIFTPPDVISQIMMGVPMVILYELSILISRLVNHRLSQKRCPDSV